MVGSAVLQGSNLGPRGVGWIVLEHLQTSKTSHHQLKNFTQYLISVVATPIVATGDNHLLVQVCSSETKHRPKKNFLCTEQHFLKVHTSMCIYIVIIMVILMLIDGMIGAKTDLAGAEFKIRPKFWSGLI